MTIQTKGEKQNRDKERQALSEENSGSPVDYFKAHPMSPFCSLVETFVYTCSQAAGYNKICFYLITNVRKKQAEIQPRIPVTPG